jgi:hypothetical protein
MADIIEQMVDLRLRAYEGVSPFSPQTAREAKRQAIADRYQKAQHSGHFYRLDGPDGLDAFLMAVSEPESSYGVPLHRLYLAYRLEAEDAVPWLKETVANLPAGVLSQAYITLDVAFEEALQSLRDLGMCIEYITLLAGVSTAKSRLLAARTVPTDLSHLGLCVEPLATPAQAEAASLFKQRVFAADVKYVPFAINEAYVAWETARLTALAGLPDQATYIIRAADGAPTDILGVFDAAIGHKSWSSYFGSTASVGLTLDRSIQGQDLATFGYATVLARLEELGVQAFVGASAHPSVLHLSRVMGRQQIMWVLRAGTGSVSFEDGHFDYP